MSCHAFIDKSRRKPFVCGKCGRDITHPYHQPQLEGIIVSPPEPEPEIQVGLFEEVPQQDDRQASLF